MKPVYKRVKAIAEFCPECKERLSGNNSYYMPWECRCGIWKAVCQYPWNGEYEIIKRPLPPPSKYDEMGESKKE